VTEKKLIRRITTATLESRASMAPAEGDLALIAKQVPAGWPAPTEDAVYCASALVCNNLIDHYSTQFTDAALAEIAGLIVGTNVMRNHDEYGLEALPIGRCYAAELVEVDGAKYVRAWFYWERGTAFGDEMAKKIALGIWREVSLSWWMRSFTMSPDGFPIEDSAYYPGQVLPDGTVAIGIMADIVEVNEFSIVPRGGQKNTSMNPAGAKLRSGDDVLDLVGAARARGKKPKGPWSRWFPDAA
jgi:hypothetical protein